MRAFLRRLSLRTKVTLGVVVPLLLILGVFTAVGYARHRQAVFANLSFLAAQIGQVIEDSIRHEMVSTNLDGLQHMLDAIGEGQMIRAVYLLNTNGKVVFAPEHRDVGQQLDNADPSCQPCHRLPAADRPGSVIISLPDGDQVFRSMTPIENRPECHACHAADQRLIGVLLTDISMAPIAAPLAGDLRANILWWIVTITVTLIIVNLAVSRLVVRRLEVVAAALARFGRGQLDLRLPAEASDEIGQLSAAFNQMGGRIQAEEAENRALSDDLRRQSAHRQDLLRRLITAQEEERRRVARDLHDDLGQGLGGLAVSLEVVERLWSAQPEQARAQLEHSRALIADAAERAYEMILALRPSALDDLGLVPALRAHAERALKDSGVQFELDARELTRRLPPETEVALFRTFQEALTNVVRHAGASRVRIVLAWRDGAFEGEICDDGQGFDMDEVRALILSQSEGNGHGQRGLGLLGLQERVEQHCGTLEIDSRPGAGTRIRIRLPLAESGGG